MLVLAAVPTVQFHKLRRAAAPRFPVTHAQTWDVALATIRARPVELAVVDPQLAGAATPHEIARVRLLFPSLPLVLYTALSPATAAVLLALGQSGINDVVFHHVDDHPARLREGLSHVEAPPAGPAPPPPPPPPGAAASLPRSRGGVGGVVEAGRAPPAELQTVQQVATRARV